MFGFQREASFTNINEPESKKPRDTKFYNKDRATLIIVDRGFDFQTVLSNDYSYGTNVFEALKIPDNYCINELIGKNKKEHEKVYLNESDFMWSNYKYTHIAEFKNIMINYEIEKLKKYEKTKLK